MNVQELRQLISMLPSDSKVMCLVKSNVAMEIKDIQVVNDKTVLLIPFGMKPSDTLLQDFENTDKP